MSKSVKDCVKESFMNGQFIAIAIATVVLFFLYMAFKTDLLLYLFLTGTLFIALYIIGFFNNVSSVKSVENAKEGSLKYEPYIVDKETFIEDCKSGLMYSLVRINNNIYGIETQLDKISSINYDKFICYINDEEITGLDNFLNYKFDGTHSFNDLHNIEFLEYNHNDPKEHFENNAI